MSRAPPCKCRELDRVQFRDYRLVDRSCRPTGGGRSGVGNFVSERKRSSGSPLHQRSHSCTIRHASVAQVVEPLPSKQRTRVQFPPPAPPMPRSSKWPRTPVLQIGKRGSNPARGTTGWPLRLAGRAPGFDLGRLGSNPRGAAIFQIKRGIAQLVERGFHTPRQPQVRTLLPRPSFAGLAKWEGNGSWPRHEAVRSRQPVRACSSSVERRIPNPRQRGFNSFLARHRPSVRCWPP